MDLLHFVQSGILNDPGQYRGDGKLLMARGLLTPEERPTVPVEAVDPGHVIGISNIRSRKDNQFLPIRVRPEAGMVVPKELDHIYVNRKSREYRNKDLRHLAAQLGHEQVHVRGEKDERPAYQAQIGILERLGAANPELITHLKKAMQLYGD